MNENPETSSEETSGEPLTSREAYNAVTDTVGGPNIRLKDNLFQLIAVSVCTAIGAGAGTLVCSDRRGGVLAGAFIGMVVGLFGSGLFLMIYRAVKHLSGQHK